MQHIHELTVLTILTLQLRMTAWIDASRAEVSAVLRFLLFTDISLHDSLWIRIGISSFDYRL